MSSTHRNAKGQFVEGNTGGPGNPHGRSVARIKRRLLEACTDERMDRLTDKLFELAEQGDVQAIKLILAYSLGKPTPGREPDEMDQQELELEEKQKKTERELAQIKVHPLQQLDAQFLENVRTDMNRVYMEFLTMKYNHIQCEYGLREPVSVTTPSPNGFLPDSILTLEELVMVRSEACQRATGAHAQQQLSKHLEPNQDERK